MSGKPFRHRLRLGERLLEVDLHVEPDGRAFGQVSEAGAVRRLEARVERAADGGILVRRGGRLVRAWVRRQGDVLSVSIAGRTFALRDAEAPDAGHGAGDEPFAVSPMTGVVAKVAVAPGARVAAGGALFMVEAMKMEYVVRAPRALVVREVRRAAGQKVALGDVVVAFDEAPGGAP